MSYEKTVWAAGVTLITTARLRNLETQYEKALIDARVANNPLLAEVDSSAPAGVAGQIYYDTTDEALYGHDGTSWIRIADERLV